MKFQEKNTFIKYLHGKKNRTLPALQSPLFILLLISTPTRKITTNLTSNICLILPDLKYV